MSSKGQAMSLASLINASKPREKTFAEYMAEQQALDAAARLKEQQEEQREQKENAAQQLQPHASPVQRIRIDRGASIAAVRSAADIDEQVERLNAWEAQLQEYSDQLTEQGWSLWKKSAVTSVMNQLQRRVVPDSWKGEVTRLEQEVSALQERVRMGSEKERALLAKLHEVENGPGCARELREQLEAAALKLDQQQQRERQNSVFKQLLTSGSVSNNVGGGAPALRRSASSSERGRLRARSDSVPFAPSAGPSIAADTDSAVATSSATQDADGVDAESAMEIEALRVRLATAERDALEARDETKATRTAADERSAALEAALEAERKKHRHAVETLESVHLDAGVHEAQEMVQLRMALVAAQEELDFLRGRQAKLHEEEHRLQMVAEMSKRLGTNVSKFELDALRKQLASVTEEAERVQRHNEELQREAKKHVTDMHAVERLKGEIGAFQEANDRLEGELLKRDRHAAALKEHVRAAHARTDLLQRQLALSHRTNWSASTRARTSPDARAADEADRAASGLDGSLRTAPGARRQLPLLWDDADSPSVGTTGTATVAGAAPVGERDRPLVSRLPPTAGSPHRPSGGGASGITHRAVALHDEVASEPIRIEVIPPAQPRLVQPFLRDAARPVRLKDNARELSAAMAWREAEAVHAVQLQAELRRQAAADAQELRVVRASLATRMLHARTAKLGALKHYRMLGLQRALCQWALLLELDGSYHAALKQAASILEEQASTLTAAVGDTQQRTVDTLLLEPQMLGELGEMRRRLQLLHAEGEGLREGLRKLCDTRGRSTGARAVEAWLQPAGKQAAAPLRERLALPMAADPAETGRQLAACSDRRAALERLHEENARAIKYDAVQLQLRLVLPRWRAARRTVERQGLLLRQLSEQRNHELEAAASAAEAYRRTQADVHDLRMERETWRQQSAEQADVIAAAIAAAARTHDEHKEEVAVLSEKLCQILEESDGLRALCDSQAADLKVLSDEIVRLMHAEAAPESSGGVELEGWRVGNYY
ncbi:hypothetical protein Ctob_003939 [Chrysochromulina tobinii]|uniref:Uncharacterized protein n=1 Tax=Chrysochromulina tobinii TaxID=1460289 RepID=A0A0M0J3P5_9EUKA|nr:hypothetical protein Ctob_003939 [Chrysochromulina tobinii]|eukprot:KOO20873.1 hypothetical protein Ctob_003939 [Chrysochromulina sp. CCMP291]